MAKKNIQKLFALILAVSMVMSISVNAATGLKEVCGKTAHTHTYACNAPICGKTEENLDQICGKAEHVCTEACHVHGEGCYAPCTETYDCTDTTEGHEHGEACPAHQCTEACKVLTCTEELCVPHVHVEGCFAPHEHVELCYEGSTELVCEIEAHTHTDACDTVWYGDEVELDVEEGTDGYTYMLFGDIDDDKATKDYYYYETSNHVLVKTGGGAVHVLALIDTAKHHGEWTPDGVYNCGESNFDLVYCCDAVTGSEAGDYYKRLNLEDSEYFTAEEAAKLRAILTNSYPFVSVEEAKAALKSAGFEQADELDRSELISATQAAVWSIANKDSGDSYDYAKTASTPQKNGWGGYLHDFTNEPKNFADSTKKTYTTPEGVGERVNALKDFLLAQDKVSAKRTQVVISNLSVMESIAVQEKEGTYTVVLRVELNNSGSSKSKDDLAITVYVDGEAAKTVDVKYGTEVYDLTVEAGADSEVVAVVSGTQVLPQGVYFYAPKPADLDGDGVATSREVSQNLIGVAGGVTPIHAEAEIELDLDEETTVTGALQLQKVDEFGQALTGAAFDLYAVGEKATLYVDTYAVDENGQLTVDGLLTGNYELVETQVPDGYLKPKSAFAFSIDANGALVGADVADGIMTVVNELPKYTVTYISEGETVQKTKNHITGDDIPACDDPYKAGYSFKGWKLTEGKPDGDLIGTTDLVYVAQFKKLPKPVGPKPEKKEELTEIKDDDIPLAEIPELFGDDHFAYIIGRDDGLVHPEANITRAEVATIFFRLLAEEVRNALMTDVNGFSDVDKGQWYNHAVSTLSTMGIVRGRADGSYYDPDAFITRAEFAAIAARFDPTGNPEGVFFSDISGHWAEKEIIIAANNGWVEGYNGLFRPDDYITRAEAMTLVNRVLHRLPETEHDLLDYMVIWPDNMDVDAWYYLAVQEATNSHFYNRKENPVYETWTEFREPFDWSLLEY